MGGYRYYVKFRTGHTTIIHARDFYNAYCIACSYGWAIHTIEDMD